MATVGFNTEIAEKLPAVIEDMEQRLKETTAAKETLYDAFMKTGMPKLMRLTEAYKLASENNEQNMKKIIENLEGMQANYKKLGAIIGE